MYAPENIVIIIIIYYNNIVIYMSMQKTCAQYTGSKQEVEVNMARRSTAPHFWSEEETNFFISVVKTMNIMSLLVW